MNWHALSLKEAIRKIDSDEKGLSQEQAQERLKKFGRNELKRVRHFNALKVFLDQFKSFLIIILILAAILAFFLESKIDAIVILAIIMLNSAFGFSQEYKTERAIESLKQMMVPRARVLRSGKVVEINSREIVPGDILILGEGDKITADARILQSEGLRVREAALTGESVAQAKQNRKLDVSVPLADRMNMVYQGTEIVGGNGRALVIGTGMGTELGKISELVQEVKPEKNPFRRRLDVFAQKVGIFIIALALLIILLLSFSGVGVFHSFLVAVSLAVSAIPEGLPAVISLGLALATGKMLKRNVLIRKLPASETLGRTTVICTDKTGTITEEKMKVSMVYADNQINPKHKNNLLFRIGILCNKARHERDENGNDYFIGDPTEAALISSAMEAGLNKEQETEKEPKIKEFPFNSERKMMSVIRKSRRRYVSYVKGAPERIIKNSDYESVKGIKLRLSDERKKHILREYEEMAKKGLRVLGFAYKELIGVSELSEDIAEKNLVFVGFQGMIDPPRPEVKDAVMAAKEAGIKVIMITGDSKLTAEAVARDIGLHGISIDSKELAKMSDRELSEKIDSVAVFSRISPQDKLRIINILKQKQEIVAVTGDGVNDALALKRADIGIAMGIRGTDVARDASQAVLLDDNFASIVEGVREGRRVYDNIKKFIKYLLSANFSEVVLVLTVMLVWRNPELLPLLPVQILWINFATDSLPALALSTEPPEGDVMKRSPRSNGILNGIKGFVIAGGTIATIIGFIFFLLYMDNIDKARTMIVTSSIVFEMFLAFNSKAHKSVFKSPMNKYLIYAVLVSIGLHMLVIYTPINSLFYFVHLSMYEWLQVIGISFIGFLGMEGYKVFEGRLIKS
jgi:Ca2+-transporting ATPase